MIDALTSLVAPLGVLKDVELLTGGQFATTYRVTLADGARVIVKTAPTGHRPAARVRARPPARRGAGLRAGRVGARPEDAAGAAHRLHADPAAQRRARRQPPAGGAAGRRGIRTASDPRTAAAERGTGEVLAALHRLTGPAFGYPCGRQASSWAESFTGMVDELLDDAARWSVPVPAADVRAVMSRHAAVLADVVRPALVHTDLWAGNLFVDPSTGEVRRRHRPGARVLGRPAGRPRRHRPHGPRARDARRAGGVRAAGRREPVGAHPAGAVPDAALPGDDDRDHARGSSRATGWSRTGRRSRRTCTGRSTPLA